MDIGHYSHAHTERHPEAARGAPGLFAFHPANGGWRTRTEGAILKGAGVVAGVPDIIAIHDGRTYALELKRDGGKLSTAQRETMVAMARAGATVAHAVGLDAALGQLEQWGLLRGLHTISPAHSDFIKRKDAAD